MNHKAEINLEFKIGGCILAKVTGSVTITISPAGPVASDLAIDLSGVPKSGTVGEPYSGQIKVTGGTPPYKLSVDAGQLPPGVVLSDDGSLSGTPTQDGSFDAEFDAEDSAGV
jgi:hypothetical protein